MKRGKRTRQSSTLADHRRFKKTLQPPLRTLSNLQTTPWLTDTFPDMLWICFVISRAPNAGAGMELICRILDLLPEEDGAIDGTLASFDQLDPSKRGAFIDRLRGTGLYERGFPVMFGHVLGLYKNPPAVWLIGPHLAAGAVPDAGLAGPALEAIIERNHHGQSEHATHAKAIVLRARFKTGRISFPPQMEDTILLLTKYPDRISDEEGHVIRPFIRATFLAFAQATDDRSSWAQEFWRANWSLFPCRRPDQPTDSTDQSEAAARKLQEARQEVAAVQAELRTDLAKLHERFHEHARETDPDLYSPDRYEVLTGMAAHCLRLVTNLVRTPSFWNPENGGPLFRSVVESAIHFKWLLHSETTDPEIYERFKNYGRGHLKLFKLHFEDHLDHTGKTGAAQAQIDALDAEVNKDHLEEFQDIDLGGSFSGINTREMAKAVGMEAEYNLQFSPMSSVTHGEWYCLDRYSLDVCLSYAHRFHRLPQADDGIPILPELCWAAIGAAEKVIDQYCDLLFRPQTVVDDDQPDGIVRTQRQQ